jgi:hypothetical protein
VSNAPVGASALAERFTSTFFVRDGSSPDAKTHSTLRVADMLLPMGIGPVEAPVNAAGLENKDLNVRWTTLGESIAGAMGYDLSTRPGDPSVLRQPRPMGVVAGRQTYRPMFDRGNLVLDDFAPFFNTDGDANGRFTAGTNRDQRFFRCRSRSMCSTCSARAFRARSPSPAPCPASSTSTPRRSRWPGACPCSAR